MLTLTSNAVEAVRQLTGASGLEPDPGLRISPGETSPAGTELRVDLVPGPEASDQTVQDEGATVYVEPHLAEFLDDKVLDAAVEGSGVRFTLGEYGDPDTPPPAG